MAVTNDFDLTRFKALSFDCYGTLIDWEAGIAAVLSPWARAQGLDLTAEAPRTAYSVHEAYAESCHPTDAYPVILARSLRELGHELGAQVAEADAERLACSVPARPALPGS